MDSNNEHRELRELILENQRLLAENNNLLKKMHRSAVRHLWLNVLWVVFLLGAPAFFLYHFVMPMFESISPTSMPISDQLEQMNELRSLLENQ